jgi:hypothetical protein
MFYSDVQHSHNSQSCKMNDDQADQARLIDCSTPSRFYDLQDNQGTLHTMRVWTSVPIARGARAGVSVNPNGLTIQQFPWPPSRPFEPCIPTRLQYVRKCKHPAGVFHDFMF